MITEDVAEIGDTLDARQTVLSKEIATDATCSDARIFQTPREVRRMIRDITTTKYGNTVVETFRLTPPVQICHSITDSPSQNRNQDIINPIGPVIPQWTRNAKKLKTSIDGFFALDRGIKNI